MSLQFHRFTLKAGNCSAVNEKNKNDGDMEDTKNKSEQTLFRS